MRMMIGKVGRLYCLRFLAQKQDSMAKLKKNIVILEEEQSWLEPTLHTFRYALLSHKPGHPFVLRICLPKSRPNVWRPIPDLPITHSAFCIKLPGPLRDGLNIFITLIASSVRPAWNYESLYLMNWVVGNCVPCVHNRTF